MEPKKQLPHSRKALRAQITQSQYGEVTSLTDSKAHVIHELVSYRVTFDMITKIMKSCSSSVCFYAWRGPTWASQMLMGSSSKVQEAYLRPLLHWVDLAFLHRFPVDWPKWEIFPKMTLIRSMIPAYIEIVKMYLMAHKNPWVFQKPSIARGNEVCNPICANFPIAPVKCIYKRDDANHMGWHEWEAFHLWSYMQKLTYDQLTTKLKISLEFTFDACQYPNRTS